MNLEARISGIRDLLVNGDLSEAITTTSELVDEIGKDSFNYSIYLIHEQYNQLIRDNVEGNLSRESMLLERNKITLSVLQLLQVIQYQESERKKKPFFYAQIAIAALSLLLIISVAYIFFSKDEVTQQPSTAIIEQEDSARPTIVNSHPEDVLYDSDNDTLLQDLNIPSNESYFDAVPEEVNYQQNIFDLSDGEFGITLRFVDENKSIDELIETPTKISISKLKNKLISHFNLETSDFPNAGSNAEWQLFANDKRVTKENRNLESAGLFDYDLIMIKYVGGTEESSDEAIANLEEVEGSFAEEEVPSSPTVAPPATEVTSSLDSREEDESLTSVSRDTPSTTAGEPPIFTTPETSRSSRPPARTVDGPPQLPEIETPPASEESEVIEEPTTTPTPPKEEETPKENKKKEKENKKERSKEDRKKDNPKDGQTFSYLIFIPGETSVHLRQSNEVFNTKTNDYYNRNSFTQEDLDLLTNRKLLIRDRDGQKLYTTLRSSSNQYFVAVEGGVGASEEDFYTIIVGGKKMAAVPISSKEYDRLLKIANSAFKGPRVDNVSVKGNGSDFTKKSIILIRK
ncbi:MAG: hypothetical protein AAGG68_28720 [Bacteroidota bacterium]